MNQTQQHQQQATPPQGAARGVSLIEAMISLTILFIGIVGLVGAFQAQIFSTFIATNHTQATMIVETVANELAASPYGEWDLDTLQTYYQFDAEGNRTDDDDSVYYSVEISQVEVGDGWTQLAIGVTWVGWRLDSERAKTLNPASNFAYEANIVLSAQYDLLSGG
ncbi:type IV pilus modification PilV family protein [Acanthopleuribacter pedis]|uniref:Uncharacterized protein n=1 Tax=Acanthopleuribacter pedis TaxID=442870 RepID=A0A8J7U6Y5_9BACT|nr:hypothetical protein [Acanthopleuribacter pedis]MBO1320856.1 hypothetical protein [Acanthopleuribacter pedis]